MIVVVLHEPQDLVTSPCRARVTEFRRSSDQLQHPEPLGPAGRPARTPTRCLRSRPVARRVACARQHLVHEQVEPQPPADMHTLHSGQAHAERHGVPRWHAARAPTRADQTTSRWWPAPAARARHSRGHEVSDRPVPFPPRSSPATYTCRPSNGCRPARCRVAAVARRPSDAQLGFHDVDRQVERVVVPGGVGDRETPLGRYGLLGDTNPPARAGAARLVSKPSSVPSSGGGVATRSAAPTAVSAIELEQRRGAAPARARPRAGIRPSSS